MKRTFLSTLLSGVVIAAAVLAVNPLTAATDPAAEAKITQLIASMTLAEKTKMALGDTEGKGPRGRCSAEIARLGIRAVPMFNGPRGQTDRGGTSFPIPIAQAATFDPELVMKVAAVIAKEHLAKKTGVLLAPSVNIQRDPLCGRTFEYYTEDPQLNDRLAFWFTKGAQEAGINACVKHFIANSQENHRGSVDSVVDERAMREAYLSGFRGAVAAGVRSAMTGANVINGIPNCGSAPALGILKNELGFDGMVLTDWGGAEDTVRDANAGLDLSMPGKPGPFESAKLVAAVQAGQIPEKLFDDKVRRVLRAVWKVGKIDGAPPASPGEGPNAEHSALARRVAEEAVVLLKNEGGLLPLDPSKLKKVAVLGPKADEIFQGGGSSTCRPAYEITFVAGLKKVLGAEKVDYVRLSQSGLFVTIPAAALRAGDNLQAPHGLKASYRGQSPANPAKKATSQKIVETVDYNFEMASPDREKVSPDNFTAVWSGLIVPPVDGVYQLRVSGKGKVRLSVDGQNIADNGKNPRAFDLVATRQFKTGVPHPVKLMFEKEPGSGKDAIIKLSWATPDADAAQDAAFRDSIEAARKADVAIVCVGQNHDADTEGKDRDHMKMTPVQERLVNAVAKVNPKTIVIVYTGSPLEMGAFIDRVPAVVLPWYAGQENGQAVAAVLTGAVNPSGRLPITFPARLADSPAAAERQQEDRNEKCIHAEGIFVGYRWFDREKIAPLFPFGHGLSYTTFRYANLRVDQASFKAGEPVRVSVDVENTGKREGDEVVQLYVHDELCSVPRPLRELKAFQRVSLKPGEKKSVTLTLDPAAFVFWNTALHRWELEAGEFKIEVAASSRDIRLAGRVTAATAGFWSEPEMMKLRQW